MSKVVYSKELYRICNTMKTNFNSSSVTICIVSVICFNKTFFLLLQFVLQTKCIIVYSHIFCTYLNFFDKMVFKLWNYQICLLNTRKKLIAEFWIKFTFSLNWWNKAKSHLCFFHKKEKSIDDKKSKVGFFTIKQGKKGRELRFCNACSFK
jgi:hypothetical protein